MNASSEHRIRTMLVDDDEIVRRGLALILSSDARLELVGEAHDGDVAVRRAVHQRPDVVLMDVRMPTMDGIAATRELIARVPSAKVVILTTFEEDEYVVGALRAGASGFLLKRSSPEELLRAIYTVAAGDALLSPSVTRRVIERFAVRGRAGDLPHPELSRLTDRERDILGWVATGASNDEIADSLVLSPATVRTHVGRAMTKLGARDRAQLVVFAIQSGLTRDG